MKLQPIELLFFCSLVCGVMSRIINKDGISFELLIALFCIIVIELKNYLEKQKTMPLDELRQEIEQLKSDVSALRISQGFRGE